MNFRKASIFQRDTEKPEEQNDSGGMLAVWGSPGSGKTVTAVKIAKMLSARKKNVILLLCDMAAPMLPCICPADALESNGSLAGVLAAARISENLIKHNLVTFKRNSCLAVLGLLERQNEYSTLALACYAFGQNFNVTPLSLINAQAACVRSHPMSSWTAAATLPTTSSPPWR